MSAEKEKAESPRAATEKKVTAKEDKASHQATIKIIYDQNGKEIESPLSEFSPDFEKAILLVEDTTSDSDRCRDLLHELGYSGIQLISNVEVAKNYLDDVLDRLTHPPDAMILDLGLGNHSGFEILRKCHASTKLSKVPILVWTKHDDARSEDFSMYLGAKDFLVKSSDKQELRETLKKLLAPKEKAA